MDTTINRRRLLSAAVLSGAGIVGATALGSLAPEAAFAADPVEVDPGAPDPNFVEGRISSITGTTLLVNSSDGSLHRLQITVATSIWKLHPAGFEAIAVGDGLYARGVRMPDGSLATDSLWLNIVNVQGHVAAIGRNVLHLDHKGRRIVAHAVPGRSAAVYNGTPAVSDLSMIKVGGHVQVLGAWHPDTNEIDIATVYARA